MASGQPVFGGAVMSWSPAVVEASAAAGLDFVRIDCEHAWRRDEMIEHMIRAAWLGGTVPLVRIEKGDPFLVRKALEIGAGALLVSDVRTAHEARAVVDASHFAPIGSRGFSGNCFSGGWGTHPSAEWIEWSNAEPMIGVMLEHPEAMANLDAILAVPELDFVYFGPGDYSISIGLRETSRDDPRVIEAFERTVRSARHAGLHALANPGTSESVMRRLLDLGVDMLEFGNELSAINTLWANARKTAQGLTDPSKANQSDEQTKK